jgi:hypothetical protein
MPTTLLETPAPIQHPNEEASNAIRRRLAAVEPHCIRTFTPSMAVLAKSAGSYHWTPEGRKLADFSSGVLVMNLGHNPTRWWQRVKDYLGLHNLKQAFYYANYALTTAQKIHALLELRNAVGILNEIYAQRKDYETVYYYSKWYKVLNDSVTPEQYRHHPAGQTEPATRPYE